MNEIQKILKDNGPLPSSKIKQFLLDAGISEDASRQRISRARGNVRRLHSLSLPNKEKFLYLDHQFATDNYWEALIKAHNESNSAYGIAFQALLGCGGICTEEHFHIISGAPKKLTNHTGTKQVLERLIENKLLKRITDPNIGNLIILDAQGYFDYQPKYIKRARLLSEEILLKGLKDWIRKLGFGSYERIETTLDDKIPNFGQFDFSLVAPSYLYPLVEKKNGKAIPGFIVSDVIYQTLNVNQIQFFLKKCRINRKIKNMRPFLGILLAERFTEEAFKLGKSEGLIFATPENLFSQDIARALEDLIKTLENAAAIATTNPDKISTLFASLTKLAGAENNIKGALFELIVGHVVLKTQGNTIDIGVSVIAPNGREAEIDVRRVKGEHELGIYECKSRPPDHEIEEGEVKKWFSERVPIIRSALMQEIRFQNTKMEFEYWTTGKFSSDALKFMKKLQSSTKKYRINWKDGAEVLKEAKRSKAKSLITTLKSHYLQNPW